MHSKDARAHGETEQRLYLLDAWRESPLYSRSRTRRAGLDRGADADRADPRAGCGLRRCLKRQFTEAEQVKLTLLIGAINAWNRLAIGFRLMPSGCRPLAHAKAS